MEQTIENKINTAFIVKKIHFENLGLKGSFQIKPQYSVSFKKLSDTSWETEMGVEIKNTTDNPFPLNIEVTMSLVSTFSNVDFQVFDLSLYLKQTSLQMLFPYIRSSITNICNSALIMPIYLPVIDVNKIVRDIKIDDLDKLIKEVNVNGK